MKLVKTPVAMFGLALMVFAAAAYLPRPVPVVADEHDHAHGEDGEHAHGHDLHETMEAMEPLYRQVRRLGRRAPNNAETIENLHALATLALSAKDHLPAMLADLPASEREAHAATYRTMMNDLVMHLLAAENALLKGDNAAAWESILAANEVKGQGHELFIPEPEEEE